MTPAVRIRDLRYRYRGSDHDVLRLGAFDVEGPGLVAVVGRTGVGKTTLMELIAGTLREPYLGSIQVLGVELRELRRDADRQRHLRRVGLVPQDFGLLPGSTVHEILVQDLADAQVPVPEHETRVRRALDRVGLLSFAARNSEQLSGGQRQRVAIARTLARDVDLIIADEPTANLDPRQAESTMALFEELGASRPVVIVTHDTGVAERCGRIVALRPLEEHVSSTAWPCAHPVETAARMRRGVTAGAGMLILALATVGSTLAVRATNAHHTSPGPAVAEVQTAGRPGSRASRPLAPPPAGTLTHASVPPPAAAPLPARPAPIVEVAQTVRQAPADIVPARVPPSPGRQAPAGVPASPSPAPTVSPAPPTAAGSSDSTTPGASGSPASGLISVQVPLLSPLQVCLPLLGCVVGGSDG